MVIQTSSSRFRLPSLNSVAREARTVNSVRSFSTLEKENSAERCCTVGGTTGGAFFFTCAACQARRAYTPPPSLSAAGVPPPPSEHNARLDRCPVGGAPIRLEVEIRIRVHSGA